MCLADAIQVFLKSLQHAARHLSQSRWCTSVIYSMGAPFRKCLCPTVAPTAPSLVEVAPFCQYVAGRRLSLLCGGRQFNCTFPNAPRTCKNSRVPLTRPGGAPDQHQAPHTARRPQWPRCGLWLVPLTRSALVGREGHPPRGGPPARGRARPRTTPVAAHARARAPAGPLRLLRHS